LRTANAAAETKIPSPSIFLANSQLGTHIMTTFELPTGDPGDAKPLTYKGFASPFFTRK